MIVNGRQVVKEGEFQNDWADQPIRFAVEEGVRHEPLSVDERTRHFATPTISVDDGGAKPGVDEGRQACLRA
jgi:hypothetical protein